LVKWILNRVLTDRPAADVEPAVLPETGEPLPTRMPAPPEAPRKRGPWVAIASIVVLVVAAGIWALVSPRREAADTGAADLARTAAVERRDFLRTLRIHGTVEAVQSHTVSAPRLAGPGSGTMIITRLIAAGTTVRRGDFLVEFDRQNQIKAFLDRQAEYRDLVEQIKKKEAEHSAARARDQTELTQAENAVQTAALDMRKNEVVSRIDAEKNQQNLEESRARLAQLRETFNLKESARRAELRILEIQRDRAENAMRHAERNSDRMAIRSPLDGLTVLNSIWKGGQMGEVQEGDEVRPGVPFLLVVNPAQMQARARVNQVDVRYLRPGQPVQIRLDAYPDLVFPGRVERIAAVGITSSLSQKLRSFAATFSLQGNHANLMPDLSAALDVELERVPDALVAPRDAIVSEGGQNYVYVQRGSGYEKRAVTTGAMNDHEIVIASGVEAGAVLLRNPQAAGVAPEAPRRASGESQQLSSQR